MYAIFTPAGIAAVKHENSNKHIKKCISYIIWQQNTIPHNTFNEIEGGERILSESHHHYTYHKNRVIYSVKQMTL